MFEYTEKLAKEISEKISSFEVKENVENGTFKVVASDETVDRSWETIKVSSWDLKNYMKNPIILFWHEYRSLDCIAWKATNVYVEKNQLVIEGVFAWTQPAQMLRQLYDEGILKTVSVGFIAKQRDPNNSKVITEAELLELSFVPVPCNPNALSLEKEVIEGMIETWILKEVEEWKEENNEEETVIEDDTTDNENSENQDGEIEENKEDEKTLDNEEEKTINKEIVEVDEPITLQMKKLYQEKFWDEYKCRIVEIYAKHFVVEIYREIEEGEFDEKIWYYDQNYSINGNVVELVGDAVKVEPKTVWVEKSHKLLIKDLISEIKGFWISDDKESDVEKANVKIQMQKETLQDVSKLVSECLHKIKL